MSNGEILILAGMAIIMKHIVPADDAQMIEWVKACERLQPVDTQEERDDSKEGGHIGAPDNFGVTERMINAMGGRCEHCRGDHD